MKNLRFLVLALIAVAIVGALGFSPALPKAIAALSEMQLPSQEAASASLAFAAPAPATGHTASLALGTQTVGTDLQSAIERVYQQNKDSVVNIQVTMDPSKALGLSNIPGLNQLPQIPGLPDLGQLLPNLPGLGDQGNGQGNQQDNGQGAPNGASPFARAEGSGFVWDKDGRIVTNNHVVDGATKIRVNFADGTSASATVVGTDADSDLAVIKVDPKGLTLKPINVGDSTQVQPGQFTLAIGNPFGLEGTLTFGIVSAVGRSMPAQQESLFSRGQASYTIPDVIQTDAPINPGNSGGVLLDLDGNLIGVPTAIESSIGQSAGIGFAVPSAIVRTVVPALIKDGKFEHAWLGLSGATLVPDLATAMGLQENQRGALVSEVTSGSPAEKAGVKGSSKTVQIDGQDVKVGGDVITAIDNQPVQRFDDLVTYLARSGKAGQTVTLKVLRDGKETTLQVTLGTRPAQQATAQTGSQQGQQAKPTPQARPNQGSQSGGAWLGINGLSMTSEIASAMKVDANTQGVLVESVAPNSPADKAGLVAGENDFATGDGQTVKIGGDIITKVDGKAVSLISQLSRQISQGQPGQKVVLTVLRDGEEQEITVTLAARPAQGQ